MRRIIDQSFIKLLSPIYSWYIRLSYREKGIIISGILVLVPLFGNEILVKPIRLQFDRQSLEINQLKQDVQTIPFILDRYLKVATKRSQIEEEFKQVEIKEGEQSLLETILTGKVDPGFDITPGPVRAFGGSYEQASFTVRFSVSSLGALVSLLSEITTGGKRMLLTSASIAKDASGEKLKIELTVSSIRRK